MATHEHKKGVEKVRVPKMATHFESLAEKGGGEVVVNKDEREPAENPPGSNASPSLEEISNMRATAQQSSIGAIRAAEERYQDQKAEGKSVLDHASKVAAKDAAMESGKGVSEYALKVKDKAVVAGWGATHYTLEKVVDATKTVAGVTSSVAGYAKDKVAGAGQTVGGYAGEKLAAAKDAVVATEEKAADYAGRKKAEAQKSSRWGGQEHDEGGLYVGSKEQRAVEERLPSENMEEYSEGAEGGEQTSTGGTVFQAVGETIIEIGQTTKDLLAGQNPLQGKSEKKNVE